ncbi:MAG TPA: hypothetical protein VJL31_15580 [Gemmatimonadales bacterium]|jgi:hypothetical protein|nr:hypothetical protein [Gemmatimonadales bacterium]
MRFSSGLLPTLITLLACTDPTLDPPPVESAAPPTVQEVAGSYNATTFTTREGGVTIDRLAQGALLDIVLQADSTTTGRLFVPDGAEDGGDFDANLAGTWVLRGDTVEFDHMADTFVRDMPFVFSNNKLTGERTFGTTTVLVVLSKQ